MLTNPQVARLATWPRKITLLRWQNGKEIGSTPLLPKMQDTYGFPYFLIHRGDLHKILLNKAYAVGVDIQTSSWVSNIEEDAPSITLSNGAIHRADVIIGSDGRIRNIPISIIKD